VFSSKAHAEILSVDASNALSMPGVFDFICHKDVPGNNNYGIMTQDEEIFATKTVSLIHIYICTLNVRNAL
jgi:xanthine dehydrogenase molybdopterin-binding subunit B